MRSSTEEAEVSSGLVVRAIDIHVAVVIHIGHFADAMNLGKSAGNVADCDPINAWMLPDPTGLLVEVGALNQDNPILDHLSHNIEGLGLSAQG